MQCSTVQYSIVQHSTVLYSIATAITCRHECVCTVEHTYTHTPRYWQPRCIYTVAIHINNNNNNNNKRPALYTHLVYAVKRAPVTVTDITNEWTKLCDPTWPRLAWSGGVELESRHFSSHSSTPTTTSAQTDRQTDTSPVNQPNNQSVTTNQQPRHNKSSLHHHVRPVGRNATVYIYVLHGGRWCLTHKPLPVYMLLLMTDSN